MRKPHVFVVVVTLFFAVAACATYREELSRAQQAFEKNDHERALALLRDLERAMTSLGPAEQAKYAYLRGMTDYRVGYRADARHWLALANVLDEQAPGALAADWKRRTVEALAEMNSVVYAEGFAALAVSPRADEGPVNSGSPSGRRPPAADLKSQSVDGGSKVLGPETK